MTYYELVMPMSGLVGRIDAQLSLPLAFIGKPSILRRLNGRTSGVFRRPGSSALSGAKTERDPHRYHPRERLPATNFLIENRGEKTFQVSLKNAIVSLLL